MPQVALRDRDAFEDARRRGLIREDAGNNDNARSVAQSEEKSAQFLSIETLRQQYTDYLTNKVDEIEEQKLSRRYYHGAFYSADELRVLKDRHQPPLPWNRTARKINRRVGLIQRLRSDPKATGRNPKSEAGAEIATQSIRSVLDGSEFKALDPWSLLQAGIDGFAGVQLILKHGDQGDIDIAVEMVIGDEYFYDPKNYRMDFKSIRFEGISKWFDLGEAIDLFPRREDMLRGMIESGSDLTTNPDREIKWTMTTAQRIRIVEHWYVHKGQWCWAFYTGTTILDQGVSPFVNEKGKSCSSFYMYAAAIDHDGDIYGFVRNMKGPQDALNAGKSKTLHLANTKLVQLTKGAVDDVEILRREVARPDGTIEVNPGFENGFQIVDTKADLAAFVQFTQDAKEELDQDADANLAMLPGNAITNISGRAIELLRQPGMAELGPFILSYRAWKLRLYRGIWNAIQRHWTKERWLRVSGDDNLAQFIQLNGLGLDQFGRLAIVNAVGSLDVNIVLEEGPDVASLMQDTYDALKGYPPGTFPPQVLIEINPNIPRSDKNRLMQMMMPKPPPPGSIQEMVQKLQLEGLAGKNAKQAAETRRAHAQSEKEAATAHEKMASVGLDAQAADRAAEQFAIETMLEAAKVGQALQPKSPSGTSQPQPQPQMMPPAALGARLAPDGRHYLPDPRRPGKYLMVVH